MKLKINFRPMLLLTGALVLVLASFQNCSGVAFDNATPAGVQSQSTPAPAPLAAPLFNPACAAATQNHCSLAANASGNLSGSCGTGYTGSCSSICSNGLWTAQSNSCTPINPVTVIAHGNPFVFHAAGNTGSINFEFSGNQFTGDNFPNWQGTNTNGQTQVGIVCKQVGSVTATNANSGTVSFVRSDCNGSVYQPQIFVGTWSTTDFVHVRMSGTWTWQNPNSYLPGGGPWDISN